MLKLKSLPVIADDTTPSSPVLDFLSRIWTSLLRSPTPGISRPRSVAPELELYAEASAPEGALYVPGRPSDYLSGTSGLYIGR
jgi:hypothetical protein